MISICGGSGSGKSKSGGGGGKSGRGGGSINVAGSSLETDEKLAAFHKTDSFSASSKLVALSKDDVEYQVASAARNIKRQENYLSKGIGHKSDLESAKVEHRVWSEVLQKGAFGANAKKFKLNY